MKKIILGILLLCFCAYQRYDYIDLSSYQSNTIKVEIKGAVVHPDVYSLAHDSTLQDLIEAAGGITENGDTSTLNQNQILHHQDVIVIKNKTEQKLISINSANLEELSQLNGIGVATAEKIIDYRTNNGPFQKLEDIMNVKGIKEKLYAKIKDQICL